MSGKPPESHLLRSALDRVLVHDIKNMGFRLQMLLRNIDQHYDDPEFKRSVQELLQSTVERLDGMVDRFSAHEDGLLIKVALDLNGVIREVAAGATRRGSPLDGTGGGAEQGILSLALGAIPEIWGDPYYLRDALWSLIDNAVEATTSSGGKVLVRSFTDVSQKPPRAVVEIIDNGAGMTKEFLRERLFKPFQTTKPEGVGLGLSTAAEIVRFHEGKISVLSQAGKPGGTIIRLIFPGIAPEPPAPAPQPAKPSGPPKPSGPAKPSGPGVE
jgi:signal transduction histidine kinase